MRNALTIAVIYLQLSYDEINIGMAMGFMGMVQFLKVGEASRLPVLNTNRLEVCCTF